ncbi:MAG: class D beta-lactamase [Fibrobacteres bacterium]|nr:class D beta-lactamase [Fibrobacterota bacterium]
MMQRVALFVSFLIFCSFAKNSSLENIMKSAIESKDVACVFIDCNSGEIITQDSTKISIRYAPCSTFKIWNTLIGAECQFIKSPDDNFYTWDSIQRFLPAWNKNLSLKEAFQVSCVPAFQILAQKIGRETMAKWIGILNYGDLDISSGINDFWLPSENKKSIMISPLEQAQLIRKLINGKLPFNKESINILQEIMIIEKTAKGVYFGKTGSGTITNKAKAQTIGWFVGYVISKDMKYSFACITKGENISGKDSKEIIKSILIMSELI